MYWQVPNWDDGFEGCWTWGLKKVKEDITFLVVEKINEKWKVFRKAYSKNEKGELSRKKLKTIWMDNVFNTEKGNEIFDDEFGARYFSAPKPVELVKECLRFIENEDIVLDFFSGSATTAHAVLELNKEDGGNRKFILVQLAEPCDETNEAYKAGYKTIAEIAKERIRRVIQKIEKEKSEKPDLFDKVKLDLGFKVFKLSPSNFKIWRNAEITKENLEEQLDVFVEPAKEGSEKENILYELMLKAGYELTSDIVPVVPAVGQTFLSDKTDTANYYSINSGELIIALDTMSKELVEEIIAAKPKKVITLDSLFTGNDQLKTNTVLQMKDADIEFKTI